MSNIEKAAKPHRDELDRHDESNRRFRGAHCGLEADVRKKTREIAIGEQELQAWLILADRRIRQFYIRAVTNNPIYVLLFSGDMAKPSAPWGISGPLNEDGTIVRSCTCLLNTLEQKNRLELERSSLASLNTDKDQGN